MARGNFNKLGQVVKDVAKALGDINIRDLDQALATIPKPREIGKRDNQIRELQKEKVFLKVQLTQKESELANVDWKIGEEIHLLT